MTLLATASQYRQQLISHEHATASAIEHAHAHAISQLDQHLGPLYSAIEAQQKQQDGQSGTKAIPLHWLLEQGRLATVLSFVSQHISTFATTVQVAITHLLHSAAQLGNQSAMAQVQAPYVQPASTSGIIHRTAQVAQFVSGRVASFAPEVTKQVKGVLLVGVSLGTAVASIAKHVAKALDAPRWQSMALAVTQGWGLFRGVQQDVWQANDQSEWIWRAHPGACQWCQDHDGKRYPVGQEMESHNHCRCDQELQAA